MKGRLTLLLVIGAGMLHVPSVSFAEGNSPPIVKESKTPDPTAYQPVVEIKLIAPAVLPVTAEAFTVVNADRGATLYEASPVALPVSQTIGVLVSNIGFQNGVKLPESIPK